MTDSPTTKRVVLFLDGTPYLLKNIERNSDGQICSAFVVNGAWDLRRVGCAFVCAQRPSPALLSTSVVEVPVPDAMGGTYSDIIAWAYQPEHDRKDGTAA